jgi:hypothetical protein
MIMTLEKENIVLVLGAGASAPYGFPTARELRADIIENFANRFSSIYRKKDTTKDFIFNGLLEDLNQFQKRFDLSSIESIDYFIARNPRYKELGKDAIIIHLLEYELNSKFREGTKLKNRDWYSYFFNNMIADFRNPESFSQIPDYNISILTFNYDRSLEFFLAESIANSYEGITTQQLKDVMLKIPIIHIYGKIASLPFNRNDEGIQYRGKISYEDVVKLRQNIMTIGDDYTLNIDFSEIIKKADRIFILGFGYDISNMFNISLPNSLRPGQKLYGTAMGYNKKAISELQTYVSSGYSQIIEHEHLNEVRHLNTNDLIFEDIDSLGLLQKYL